MIAEGVWGAKAESDLSKLGRFVAMGSPVVVDGKETNQLDTVLCLMNSALLSHEARFVERIRAESPW
jgi:hypothetical protein